MPKVSTANARPQRTERPELNRERIIDAGVELAESGGLDALSLRGIAAHLGVTPMPLYRHFTNRDELFDAVVQRLLEQEPTPVPFPAEWEPAIRTAAEQFRQTLLRHPFVLDAVQRGTVVNTATAPALEGVLSALTRAGLTPSEAADVYALVFTHVVGHVSIHSLRTQAANARGLDAAEQRGRSERQFVALGEDRYPTVVEAASALAGIVDDTRFDSGVDLIVAGVRARLATL